MPKTKAQKIQAVEAGSKALKKSETLILANFTGLPVNQLNTFRKALRAAGAAFSVIKKRLLKIILEKEGIQFDPKAFEGQAGVIFSPKDIVETSGLAYKFSKTKESKDMFKILGGFELKEKKFITSEDVKKLGQLPSREILLGQLVYILGSPIRKLMFVLNERAKKTPQ